MCTLIEFVWGNTQIYVVRVICATILLIGVQATWSVKRNPLKAKLICSAPFRMQETPAQVQVPLRRIRAALPLCWAVSAVAEVQIIARNKSNKMDIEHGYTYGHLVGQNLYKQSLACATVKHQRIAPIALFFFYILLVGCLLWSLVGTDSRTEGRTLVLI